MNLKADVEREEEQVLWGQVYRGTPRLVSEVFGDGKQWVGWRPLASRPNYYVVRVDSRWNLSNWGRGEPLSDHITDIYQAVEDEFGSADCSSCGEIFGDGDGHCDECADMTASDAEWPALDDSVGGCEWFEYEPRWMVVRNALLETADAMQRADAGGA